MKIEDIRKLYKGFEYAQEKVQMNMGPLGLLMAQIPKLLAVAEAAKAYQTEQAGIAYASSNWQKTPAEIAMDEALSALEADS